VYNITILIHPGSNTLSLMPLRPVKPLPRALCYTILTHATVALEATTWKYPHRSVYGLMSAVAGSLIGSPDESTLFTAVPPGLWLQRLLASRRYQWKSFPGLPDRPSHGKGSSAANLTRMDNSQEAHQSTS
jgi:hypothetical protein